jgi:hypothetical protein
MIIPNIWKNKKCSKPPTSCICSDKARSYSWIYKILGRGRQYKNRGIFPIPPFFGQPMGNCKKSSTQPIKKSCWLPGVTRSAKDGNGQFPIEFNKIPV